MNKMNPSVCNGADSTETSLMKEIRALSFACLESSLYLNAYPDNRTALRYFEECRDRLAELTAIYEERYGALTHMGAAKGGSWDWVDGPWPWQRKED